MKKAITLCVLCCVLTLNAQISPVLLNQNIADYEIFPQAIVYYNGEIYMPDFLNNRIIKTSATTLNSPVVEVVGSLSFPAGLQLIGDELYFLQAITTADPSNDSGKLSKIDLTQTSPSVVDVLSGLNIPLALTGDANILYISEIIGDFDSGDINDLDIQSMQISEINLSGTPTKNVLFSDREFVNDLKMNNQNLYWIEETDIDTKLFQYEISDANPTPQELFVFGDDFPIRMTIQNNFLIYPGFVFDGENEFEVIKTIDLSQSNLSVQEISSQFIFNSEEVPLDALVAEGDVLYISAFSDDFSTGEESGLLYTLDLSTLSVDEVIQPNLRIQFYPNPAVSEVHFNRDIKELRIFDVAGKQVTSFNSKSASFDISSLQEGVYLLKGKTEEDIYFYKKLIKK